MLFVYVINVNSGNLMVGSLVRCEFNDRVVLARCYETKIDKSRKWNGGKVFFCDAHGKSPFSFYDPIDPW